MRTSKYKEAIEILNRDNTLSEKLKPSIDPESQAVTLNIDIEQLNLLFKIKTSRIKRIIKRLLKEARMGEFSETEYEEIRGLLKATIEKEIESLKQGALIAKRSSRSILCESILDFIVELNLIILDELQPFENIGYDSTNERSAIIKEYLSSLIEKWDKTEAIYRGSYAFLNRDNLNTLSYFKRQNKRLDTLKGDLEFTCDEAELILPHTLYRRELRKKLIRNSQIEGIEDCTGNEFIEALTRFKEATKEQSTDIDSAMKQEIEVDITLKILEVLKTEDEDLVALYDKALDIIKSASRLKREYTIIAYSKNQIFSFADNDTLGRSKLDRHASKFNKSVEETFSLTLTELKTYAMTNFVLGGGDLTVLTFAFYQIASIYQDTESFTKLSLALLATIISGILGTKGIMRLSDFIMGIPEIINLQKKYDKIEGRRL